MHLTRDLKIHGALGDAPQEFKAIWRALKRKENKCTVTIQPTEIQKGTCTQKYPMLGCPIITRTFIGTNFNSQVHSINQVGIHLESQMFTCWQLYVAWSSSADVADISKQNTGYSDGSQATTQIQQFLISFTCIIMA